MDDNSFVYRLPGRSNSQRPGAHASRSHGAGNAFAGHARLFDMPDPRRLDLRASLRAGRDEWLVRTYRQRAAIAVTAVVDVSPSMRVGAVDGVSDAPQTDADLRRAIGPKLAVAAHFVEAMGNSAFQVGDAAGLIAFDSGARDDLLTPPQHSRSVGLTMAATLRTSVAASHGASTGSGLGLLPALQTIAGREGLVFLVSDFHWSLEALSAALDLLGRATVVPLVIWGKAEITPPAVDGFLELRDAEHGGTRPVWLNETLRRRWQASIERRRQTLDALFLSRDVQPLYLTDSFAPQRLSQYFLERAA